MKYLQNWKLFESKKTEEEGLKILNNRNIKNPEQLLNNIKNLDSKVLGNNEKNMTAICILFDPKTNLNTITNTFTGNNKNDYNYLVNSNKITPLSVTNNLTTVKVDDKEFKYGELIKFQEYLHSKAPYKKIGEKGTINFNSKETPIWEGNNIEIYDGNNDKNESGIAKCIRYTGANQQPGTLTGISYPFCVGYWVGQGNQWQTYRDTQDSTFYFILDKNRTIDDPLHMVVYDNNQKEILLTDVNNKTGYIASYGTNVDRYNRYLKSMGVPVETLLVNKKKTIAEKKEDKLLKTQNKDINWFINLTTEQKSRYINRGHELSIEQFNWLINN